MTSNDHWVTDATGVALASYGPRHVVRTVDGDYVEWCPEPKAEFWGVYRRGSDGLDYAVGDVCDADSARELAKLVGISTIDPLTTAYIALGVRQYLEHVPSRNASQLDVVDAVLKWAAAVDFASHGVELSACFAYAVAFPFGEWAAARFVTMGDIDPDHARAHIAALVEAACS